MLVFALTACQEPTAADGNTVEDPSDEPVTAYAVGVTTDPATPIAGEEAELTLQVVDQLGRPIEDLQQSHERMVHSLFISRDLASFQHVHHEDFAELDVEALRQATFQFPITFPAAGDTLAVFDFAHQNVYQQDTAWIEVVGDTAQLPSPEEDFSTEREVDGLHVTLTWDVEPYAEFEGAWTITITENGEDVTDLTQWLGADGHVAIVSADLGFATHTHAWFPGMEEMGPGHEMPHLYAGPTLPFHYHFPVGGIYKMWVQFARSDAPEVAYTAAFMFRVAG
ncbi:MAG: hypothetical protein Q8P41_25510 [Pseudomonadota bacterium]|nr:hypothetical protein [Pseudomonadota bacterium]